MHLMQKCILAYIFQRKMFSCAKMHFCITFYFVKCSASHFVTQNVTNAFDAALTFCLQNVRKRQNAFWLCKNAFLHHIFQRKMFSCAKMLCFLLCKKQRCVHFVGAKMLCFLLCKKQRCVHFVFVAKMHFCINKMLQMHLMRTFCNTKCYKCI